MSQSAIITMLLVQITVTCITAYFFYKVLTTPPHPESDEVEEDD